MSQGTVQFICSPIGNLGDITYRAVESLKRADLIACEDTRHSRRLLQHYHIEAKELVAYHDHNEAHAADSLAQRVADEGLMLAVLSDAGSPTISDPGYRLVNACVELDIRVEVLPGPSAVITGLVGSGMPTDQFSFHGFLPVKSGRKTNQITAAFERPGTSVFFESPHRIKKTLQLIHDLDSARPVCVARELTKKFETYHRGTAEQILSEFGESTVKGEITLLIEGKTRKSRKAPSGE